MRLCEQQYDRKLLPCPKGSQISQHFNIAEVVIWASNMLLWASTVSMSTVKHSLFPHECRVNSVT